MRGGRVPRGNVRKQRVEGEAEALAGWQNVSIFVASAGVRSSSSPSRSSSSSPSRCSVRTSGRIHPVSSQQTSQDIQKIGQDLILELQAALFSGDGD